MRLNGAQAVVLALQEQGVEVVFGYPGGQVIPLFDALYDSSMRRVLPVHEQGAIHAADGYARVTGRPGVCIATSGPGATNIVTGLATAYLDSVPIVAITGQVPTGLIGRDAFQEIDITSVTLAMTKHSIQITAVEQIPSAIRTAFAIAVSGRPGPVLIDIPSNFQREEFDYVSEPTEMAVKTISSAELPLIEIERAVDALRHAERAILLVGGGAVAAGITAEVVALASKLDLPVTSTLMGLGGFPGQHPHFLGLTGMHGHVAANKAIAAADVIVAIGTRLSDRVTGNREYYGRGKTLIHIELDPSEVGKNISTKIPLVGNLQSLVQALTEKLSPRQFPQFWQEIRAWQSEKPAQSTLFSAPAVMRHMSSRLSGQPVIYTTDVGQNQMWAAQHLTIEQPRTWLTSGGFGTMGFGFPAAIGAQLAAPGHRVIAIVGDGGFKMTGMELYTAVNEHLPLITIVLDNCSLGMVRQWQQVFYQNRFSSTLLPRFDFVGFAHSCGAEACRVENLQEFTAAFEVALHNIKPSVIVVALPTEQLVTPMLIPGATLNDYVQVDSQT